MQPIFSHICADGKTGTATITMITRRDFTKAALAAALLPAGTAAHAQTAKAAFVSRARTGEGEEFLVGLDVSGDELFAVAIPEGTHSAAGHPSRTDLVLIDHRHGVRARVMDRATGETLQALQAERGMHFQGYGAYAPDGSRFYTSEVSFGAGDGWIGIWDAANGYARLGKIESGGTGPEGVATLSDGSLVVAHSGVQTSPLTGTEKLNIETMEPSVTTLTPEGALLAQTILPASLAKHAIRYIDGNGAGQIAFSMNAESGDRTIPYFGLKTTDGPARLIALPADPEMRGPSEAAQVVFNVDGSQIAVVLPDRNRLHILSSDGVSLLLSWQYEGIQSAAPQPDGGFLVSGSDGRLYGLTEGSVTLIRQSRRSWIGPLTALHLEQIEF